MKEHITAMLITALIITLTACNGSADEDRPSSMTDSVNSGSASENMVSIPDDGLSGTQSGGSENDCNDGMYPVTATCNGEECVFWNVRGVYGETEIPDFHCDAVDAEGSVRPIQITPIGLESIILETHTFGDYTINLVGEYVRSDNENFPDTIYARDFYVEIENDKLPSSDNDRKISYAPTILGQSPFKPEYRIFPDRIGNYLDIYDMEYPIIAMRYYLDDAPEYVDADITETIKFAMILPNRSSAVSLSGSYEAGVGIVYNADLLNKVQIVTNSETVSDRPSALCKSDVFKAANGKTLVDEAAGIKYSFDFAAIPLSSGFSYELLAVEKLDRS